MEIVKDIKTDDIINIGKIFGIIITAIVAIVLFNSKVESHVSDETKHLTPNEKVSVDQIPVIEGKMQMVTDRTLTLELDMKNIKGSLEKQDKKLDEILKRLP